MKAKARLVVLAAILVAAAAIRIRLLQVPLERDEGEYAYGAATLLQGYAPFALLYSMKLPGTQFAYAAFLALFGHSIAAIRIGLALVSSASTVLVYLLARRLFRGALPALAAAGVFAVLSLSPVFLGTFAHATHFVVLPALAGLLVLHVALASRRLLSFALAGALLGLAVLMKQPGAVFALFALAWWVVDRWRTHEHLSSAREAAALCAGIAAPILMTAAALAVAGTLPAAWFWTVSYAREYATNATLAQARYQLGQDGPGILFAIWPLLVLALAGMALALRGSAGGAPAAGMFAVGLAGASIGLYFRRHYFILAFPAAALLAGLTVRELARLAGRRAASVLLCASCAWALVAQRQVLFEATPTGISRLLYHETPFPEAIEVGRYLREHTAPEERVAVLGSEPEIFFYSQRLSATGHVYMYGLMENQPFASQMQRQAIAEIEAAQPRYVVMVRTPGSWMPRPGHDPHILRWIDEVIQPAYEKVGQVDITMDGTRYAWDEQAAAEPYGAATHVVVLRRIDEQRAAHR